MLCDHTSKSIEEHLLVGDSVTHVLQNHPATRSDLKQLETVKILKCQHTADGEKEEGRKAL
jgi:hypothetical protein